MKKRYHVSIQYGHFVQIWEVKADSKEEAREKAESRGTLLYQSAYKEIYPLHNYVTCVDPSENNNTISKEQYQTWLQEAIELGMTVDGYYGLPFTDVK